MTLVYVDTSVVLAQLLVEPRRPAEAFWASHRLVSSQLLAFSHQALHDGELYVMRSVDEFLGANQQRLLNLVELFFLRVEAQRAGVLGANACADAIMAGVHAHPAHRGPTASDPCPNRHGDVSLFKRRQRALQAAPRRQTMGDERIERLV